MTAAGLDAAGPERALDALRLTWGDAYGIRRGAVSWGAVSRDDSARVLAAATPAALNAALRADWAREAAR
jgi:hypothetical protein